MVEQYFPLENHGFHHFSINKRILYRWWRWLSRAFLDRAW